MRHKLAWVATILMLIVVVFLLIGIARDKASPSTIIPSPTPFPTEK